jgi:hypothetical protein
MNWVRDARVKWRSLLLTALARVPSHWEQLPAGLVGDRAAQITEDLAAGIAVVTLNVSEVRLQVSQRPDHLEIAVRFGRAEGSTAPGDCSCNCCASTEAETLPLEQCSSMHA